MIAGIRMSRLNDRKSKSTDVNLQVISKISNHEKLGIMKKKKNIDNILGSKISNPLEEVIGGLRGCSPICDRPETQCQCQGQQQQIQQAADQAPVRHPN